jgi:hypothetical protein
MNFTASAGGKFNLKFKFKFSRRAVRLFFGLGKGGSEHMTT